MGDWGYMSDESEKNGCKGKGGTPGVIVGALAAAGVTLATAWGEGFGLSEIGPWFWVAVVPGITGVVAAISGAGKSSKTTDGENMEAGVEEIDVVLERSITDLDKQIAEWNSGPLARRLRVVGSLMALVAATTGITVTLVTGEVLLDLPRSWWLIGLAVVVAASGTKLMLALRDGDE